jgi:hypothetical protein
MTAVRLVETGYSMFYVYDATSTLVVVGDNAASTDVRTGAIECGAGPSGFVIPTACADVWLGSVGSQACTPGDSTPTSVCH